MTDAQGLAVSRTCDAALAHYDNAVDDLFSFRPGLTGEVAAALAADPDAPMPNVLAGYLGLLGTEPAGAAAARAVFTAWLARTDLAGLLPREQAHAEAARTWFAGDIHGAGALLAGLTATWPTDALALITGHQIDFLTGDARALRDRVGGALTAWPGEDPHRGHLLGMYAFGLEEAGHYGRAREVGLEAIERDPRDVWAVHAVAHTFEMRGRFADGVRFYDERTDDWATGNFLTVHNWWHYALYLLEAGETGRALEVYDASIAGGTTVMELLDAAALLWRRYLEDDPQPARWAALAGSWAPKIAEPHYAFNDAHAMMAYLGAGRMDTARELLRSRERWAAGPRPGVGNHAMTARVGVPVLRGLLAYAEGRYDDAADALLPVRHRLNEYGGSHAQRDAVQRTLLEAALRSGRTSLARLLLSERIGLLPCSPYAWLGQARLAGALGDPAAADDARRRAEAGRLSGGRPEAAVRAAPSAW